MFASLQRASLQGDRRTGQERITSATKIRAILHQLKTDHELLYVSVAGCQESANTAILGIKEQLGVFYLDELNSATAHKALLDTRKLRVDCRLHGMELQFVAQLLSSDCDKGLALYEIALPKAMTRVQRRETFRLRLGLSPGLPPVPVTIPSMDGETISGEAFDLSATGVGALLRTRNIPSRGQLLAGVTLALPRAKPLKARIEVRFARQNSAQHLVRIGARFVDLERQQERQITQFLAEQQRRRRRHDPR
jgi:c-di-GMP-binding flagellar brake protein YcgR